MYCKKLLNNVFLSGVVAILLMSGPAFAEFKDLGNITLDTTTALEWLDLTETAGLSYNYVNNQLLTGGKYEGWRYATLSETQDIMSKMGFAAEVVDRDALPEDLTKMSSLTGYFGDTFGAIYSNFTGIAGFTAPLSTQSLAQPYYVAAFLTLDPDRLHLQLTDREKRDPATVFEYAGHFLVRLDPSNRRPVADAGDSHVLLSLGSVQLDGSDSFDEDGDAITFDWTLKTPTGSTAVLNDSSIDKPSFTADVYGNYVATLTVTDSHGLVSVPDMITVGFENVPPTANAGVNQAVVVGDTVTLDGSGSDDPNQDTISFLWNFDSRPTNSTTALINPASVHPDFYVDQAGDYVASLTVSDGILNSGPSTVLITAITVENSISASLIHTVEDINAIQDSDFANPNLRNALTNQLNAVLNMVDHGNYSGALSKLVNDVLQKTDGCAEAEEGSPDVNDWITSCDMQILINSQVTETIELIQRLVDI